MLQCWQTKRTFVIKTLNFFPTKALDFFEKKHYFWNHKLLSQKPSSWQKECWFDSHFKNKSPKNQGEIDAEQKKWLFIKFFVETTFLEKIFLTRQLHSQQAQLKKLVLTFVVKNYGSETKKINNINFLDKSFFHQNIPLESWKAVRKTSPNFFHQVSKRIHPMP